MAKAYWVNSATKSVSVVTHHSLEDIRRFVGGHIEMAHMTADGDVLYVDENGMRDMNNSCFLYYYRSDQALFGNALLVGPEVEGDQYPNGYTNLDPAISFNNFVRLIRFPL